tara:strand:+ start:9876 stop:10535 length:660 start_codon:yes stop_codon:yes gene_type:complete
MAKLKGLPAQILIDQFMSIFQNKGYSFFEEGDYNLNIIGIRNSSGDASKFDDFIGVSYKERNQWVCDIYPATTEPGPSILRNPLKEVDHKGTAILVPGQYRGTYKIDWHGSKDKGHMALCQRGTKVKVWRDNNRDTKPDYHGPEEEGWFGINIHKHRGSSARLNTGGVSAGCQVFQSSKDFYEFMETCETAADKWGNRFSYTLIEQKDFINLGLEYEIV